jgi:centromere/kinetochore protein ZW10
MMPKLCSQIKDTWLDSAVPTSLEDMTAFRKAIALVQVFANNLGSLKWAGAQELDDWVANAPRIWLTKRREMSLDWTRNQLSLGKFSSLAIFIEF